MSPWVTLCLVPSAAWAGQMEAWAKRADDARRAALDAPLGERGDEDRYITLCGHIEAAALRMAGDGACRWVGWKPPGRWLEGTSVTHSWLRGDDFIASLGNNALPPGLSPGDLVDCQVVLVASPFTRARDSPGQGLPAVSRAVPDDGITAAQQRLHRAVNDGKLLASNLSPRELARTLRALATWPADPPPNPVTILYRDGSEAQPISCGAVAAVTHPEPRDVNLRLVLMSVRHPESDHAVHGAWFRNKSLSLTQTPQASVDARAHQLSKEQLQAMRGSFGDSVGLDILLTGFEPAMVGFLRAVAEELSTPDGRWLAVTPLHVGGSGTSRGEPWAIR